ncbi:hypothetical protein A7P95_01350 [Eikenella longinqua]|uniref:Uncharacterized protein n=1 Tax=Eikenella longinqua TaxID=1795827 RepID=A0A1A9S301_9NEIS|nr:hypothetical protein [Eikenella longinqua]OAM31173.1 hypothetical protein A7P95_01350 [Eikenella longinqua]
MTEPRTLFLSGLFAALCWTAADMLLVGFVQTPEQYPLFSHTLAAALGDDVDLAVLMLAGSPQRLFWGVLPATFSAVFYLAAAFGVCRLLRGRAARAVLCLLLAGYALSPLGHAGFYYMGISAQTLLHSPPAAHLPLLAAGWLVLLVQTVRGRSVLPRASAWANPLPVGAAVALVCSLFPQSVWAAAIGGATFNIAQAVFFAAAWYGLHSHHPHPKELL